MCTSEVGQKAKQKRTTPASALGRTADAAAAAGGQGSATRCFFVFLLEKPKRSIKLYLSLLPLMRAAASLPFLVQDVAGMVQQGQQLEHLQGPSLVSFDTVASQLSAFLVIFSLFCLTLTLDVHTLSQSYPTLRPFWILALDLVPILAVTANTASLMVVLLFCRHDQDKIKASTICNL